MKVLIAVQFRRTIKLFGVAYALANAYYFIDKAGPAIYRIYYRELYWTSYAAKRPEADEIRRMTFSNKQYNQHYALLVNMGLPSNAPRMQVLDLARNEVAFKTRVMHGRSSGGQWAVHFSNRMSSNMTSLGRYVIVGHYLGKYGLAYRLAGLDATNFNALSRSLVIHQSQDVRLNRIGRSKGCLAVSPRALLSLKPYIQNGTLVWVYK